MSRRRRLLAGAALCWGLVLGAATPPVAATPAVQPSIGRVPAAVRAFLEAELPAALREIEELRREFPHDYEPEFTLLFFHRSQDPERPRTPAWLVGYRLGRQGNGRIPIDKVVLVGESGEALRRLPENAGGDCGFTLEVAPGRWAAVTSWDGGREGGGVTIYTLDAKPRLLLRYQGPENPGWESVLYFVDINGDKTKEILVERTVRHAIRQPDGTLRGEKRTDRLVYGFYPDIPVYDVVGWSSDPGLAQRIDAARADPAVPRIGHFPPPYETTLYPDEEKGITAH